MHSSTLWSHRLWKFQRSSAFPVSSAALPGDDGRTNHSRADGAIFLVVVAAPLAAINLPWFEDNRDNVFLIGTVRATRCILL